MFTMHVKFVYRVAGHTRCMLTLTKSIPRDRAW